jgi:primosomal protein N' (replication factor Y)
LERPGLLVLIDEADSALSELQAPYAHARTVLALRAAQEGVPLLFASLSRSAEAQMLVEAGWMEQIVPARAVIKAATPLISAPSAEDLAWEGPTGWSRLPSAAFSLIRKGLQTGPVLAQLPTAQHAGVGIAATARDLGRAFPGVLIKRLSAATGILDSVSSQSALVLATAGAEPRADGGYAAAVALDAAAWVAKPRLDASLDALRIWLRAAALVRPEGRMMLVGSGGGRAVQALVRWDPAFLAGCELAERRELGLPPASRAVVFCGQRPDIEDLLSRFEVPTGGRRIDEPTEQSDGQASRQSDRLGGHRTILLLPADSARPTIAALRAAIRARSMARSGGPVRVKVDGSLD